MSTDTAFQLLDSVTKDLRTDLRDFQKNVNARFDRIENELSKCARREDISGTRRPAVVPPVPTTWGRAIQHPGFMLGFLAVVMTGLIGIAVIAAVTQRDASTLVPILLDPETGEVHAVPLSDPDTASRRVQ